MLPDAEDFVEEPLVGERGEEAGGPVNVPLKNKQVPDIYLKHR